MADAKKIDPLATEKRLKELDKIIAGKQVAKELALRAFKAELKTLARERDALAGQLSALRKLSELNLDERVALSQLLGVPGIPTGEKVNGQI